MQTFHYSRRTTCINSHDVIIGKAVCVCVSAQVEPGFIFHQGNSYYDSDTNCMVIICVRYDEFPDFSAQAAVQGRSYVVRKLVTCHSL